MLTLSLLVALAIAAAFAVLARATLGAGAWSARLLGVRTEVDLAHQFVFITSRQLLSLTALLIAATAALAFLLDVPYVLWPVLCIVPMTAPRLAVQWLRHTRRKRLAQQLPDALALWAGLLKSGQGASQSLSQVQQRQAAPLGDELRMVLSQLRLGVGLPVAFQGLRERSGLADLTMLATLLHANRELGGNLAEALLKLAELLRGRLLMEARIQSLTAQGRMQGVVVGALPLLLLVVLYAMEPETMRLLHTTVQGAVAMGVIVALEVVGFVLIRRIVRIDV